MKQLTFAHFVAVLVAATAVDDDDVVAVNVGAQYCGLFAAAAVP